MAFVSAGQNGTFLVFLFALGISSRCCYNVMMSTSFKASCYFLRDEKNKINWRKTRVNIYCFALFVGLVGWPCKTGLFGQPQQHQLQSRGKAKKKLGTARKCSKGKAFFWPRPTSQGKQTSSLHANILFVCI